MGPTLYTLIHLLKSRTVEAVTKPNVCLNRASYFISALHSNYVVIYFIRHFLFTLMLQFSHEIKNVNEHIIKIFIVKMNTEQVH